LDQKDWYKWIVPLLHQSYGSEIVASYLKDPEARYKRFAHQIHVLIVLIIAAINRFSSKKLAFVLNNVSSHLNSLEPKFQGADLMRAVLYGVVFRLNQSTSIRTASFLSNVLVVAKVIKSFIFFPYGTVQPFRIDDRFTLIDKFLLEACAKFLITVAKQQARIPSRFMQGRLRDRWNRYISLFCDVIRLMENLEGTPENPIISEDLFERIELNLNAGAWTTIRRATISRSESVGLKLLQFEEMHRSKSVLLTQEPSREEDIEKLSVRVSCAKIFLSKMDLRQ